MYLTEAGSEFADYARRILALYDDMETGMKNWDAMGVLRIGSSITIGSQFMPAYAEAFSWIFLLGILAWRYWRKRAGNR